MALTIEEILAARNGGQVAVNIDQLEMALSRLNTVISAEQAARIHDDQEMNTQWQDNLRTYRLVNTDNGIKLQTQTGDGDFEDVEGSAFSFPAEYFVKDVKLKVARHSTGFDPATGEGVPEGVVIEEWVDGDIINNPATGEDYQVEGNEFVDPAVAATADLGEYSIQPGDPYIDFEINGGEGTQATHLYLNVKSLVDVYTEGQGIKIDHNNVSLRISEGNGLKIDPNGNLKMDKATSEFSGAMTPDEKAKLGLLEFASNDEVATLLDYYFPLQGGESDEPNP